MNCDEFSAVAAELALGVLAGRERADALAHAEGCDACRETVRRLTLTGEKLAELLPAAEPPPGFETAVMARVGVAPLARRRFAPRPGLPRLGLPRLAPRRLLAAAAVTLAVVAAGLGGWGLGASGAGGGGSASPGKTAARSPLSSATLVSAGQPGGVRQVIGRVYYYDGADGSRWMYLWVDAESASTLVTCQLQGPGGRFTTVGAFRLNGGYGSWASPVPAVTGPVTGARVVASDGAVLAAARFLPEPPGS